MMLKVQPASKQEPDFPEVKDYMLVKVVGQGGMGVVYRARHRDLLKTIAIKLLHKELAADPACVERFAQEARAASRLTHPNLLSVYGSGRAANGQPYLIMDFLDGKTLEEIIRAEGVLELTRFLNIFAQVCEALAHAHRKGVMHRDLKPGNIMIIQEKDKVDFVKVDLGIARSVRPAYMSPEQCLGLKMDARSDIYSLGVVMYESLTGKPPFGGDNVIRTILHRVKHRAVAISVSRPDLDLPPGLEKLIMKALEKQPIDRQQSMEDLQSEFAWIRDTLLSVPTLHKNLNRTMGTIRATISRLLRPRNQISVAAATVGFVVGLFSFNAAFPSDDWRGLAQKGEAAAANGDYDTAIADWRLAVLTAASVGAPPHTNKRS